MFQRLEILIGKDKLEDLKKKHILIIGLGGVGGYVAESMTRCGIGHLMLVDYDIVDITNINRQIIALHSNTGKKKVICFKERIKNINPGCLVTTYDMFYDKSNKDIIFNEKIDYIIDCCDSLESKKILIMEAVKRHIPIISSMGTGNKFHPEKFKICKLKQTSYDPLARKLRYLLKDEKDCLEIPVLFSQEESIKGLDKIGSISYVPSVAGLLLTSYVINNYLEK